MINLKRILGLSVILLTTTFLFGCNDEENKDDLSQTENYDDVIYSINTRVINFSSLGENTEIYLTADGVKVQSGVVYESKDSSIVTVDSNGNVISVAEGTTTISVSYQNNLYTINVTVKLPETLNFEMEITSKTSIWNVKNNYSSYSDVNYEVIYMNVGEEFQLEYSVETKDDTISDVVFKESSIESVATIDSDAKITALKDGITMITLESEYGDVREMLVGMASAFVYSTYTDFVMVVVGDEDDNAKTSYFNDLATSDLGYQYYGLYNWYGFETFLQSDDETATNDVWKEDLLSFYDGEFELNVYKDCTFATTFDYLPRDGWVESVDSELSDSTVKEAYEKYGDSYRYPGYMFTEYGNVYFYGGEVYLILTRNNATVGEDTRVKCLGAVGNNNVDGFQPFEFMNKLSKNASYDLLKTTIKSNGQTEEVNTGFSGLYVYEFSMSMGATTIAFDLELTLNSNGTYSYFRNDNGTKVLLGSGTYKVDSNTLSFTYYSNLLQKSFELTNNNGELVGSAPTGATNTNATFTKGE